MRYTSGISSCPTEGVEMTRKKNGIPELPVDRRAFRDDNGLVFGPRVKCVWAEGTTPQKTSDRRRRPGRNRSGEASGVVRSRFGRHELPLLGGAEWCEYWQWRLPVKKP